MRRVLPVLMLPALLVAGCSEEPTVLETGPTTSPPVDGADDAAATSAPAEPPTRAERRAAHRAEQWLVAFVRGEEQVCDYMLDLSGEAPMTASDSDYAICVDMIPPLARERFDRETAEVIELVEITGADVEGDRAVITREHFSELFAEGLGDQRIELRRVDGAWYVDLENSF